MSDPKRQHFVPVCYQKPFIDPCNPGYVWLFDKKTKKATKRKPENILYSKHLYTIMVSGGKKDYRIEKTLSAIESEYSKIYNEKIKNRLPLLEYEHAVLCAFTSTMLQRTLKNKDNLERFIDELISHGLPIKSGNSIHEVKDLIGYKNNFHRMNVINNLPNISNLLFQMSVAFLFPKNKKDYFITSDDPCCLFNPDLQWQRFYGPGLKQKHIQVILPLSPEVALCLTWVNLKGYIALNSYMINDLNRLIYANAYKNFISHRNRKKIIWFSKYPPDIIFLYKVFLFKIKMYFKDLKYYAHKRNF
ncbi:MAG: DUF4238 domain-containing protein [bacterium]